MRELTVGANSDFTEDESRNWSSYIHFTLYFRVTSMEPEQNYDCSDVNDVTMNNVSK